MQYIITAIISGLCVAIPSIIATITSNNKNNALIKYQIEELTEKVNAHNNLIERMFRVEARVTLLEEKIKED